VEKCFPALSHTHQTEDFFVNFKKYFGRIFQKKSEYFFKFGDFHDFFSMIFQKKSKFFFFQIRMIFRSEAAKIMRISTTYGGCC
jgi:hypothetical protein